MTATTFLTFNGVNGAWVDWLRWVTVILGGLTALLLLRLIAIEYRDRGVCPLVKGAECPINPWWSRVPLFFFVTAGFLSEIERMGGALTVRELTYPAAYLLTLAWVRRVTYYDLTRRSSGA